jgi:DNA (cytosine-5)-methyltransferase 1
MSTDQLFATGSPALEESPAIEQSPPGSELGHAPDASASESLHLIGSLPLVLSLFPGVDLLGRAFAAAGHCVVAGPDLLLGQRIEDFHSPAGRFDGVIGGPPCQNYSDANRYRDTAEGDRLVLEFLRVVHEARPVWWLMENVRNVPHVRAPGYAVQRLDCWDWEFGGPTGRLRHIQFGHAEGWIIRPRRTITERPVTVMGTVTTAPTGPGDRYSRRCAKMGFAPLALGSFTPAARRRVIGNGVPFGMGYALARAVTAAGPVTPNDCICGCGRPVGRAGSHATVACRQRTSRRRRGHTRELVFSPRASHATAT